MPKAHRGSVYRCFRGIRSPRGVAEAASVAAGAAGVAARLDQKKKQSFFWIFKLQLFNKLIQFHFQLVAGHALDASRLASAQEFQEGQEKRRHGGGTSIERLNHSLL